MRKKTIVILYVLSLVLTGIAIVALMASSAPAASTSQNCYNSSGTAVSSSTCDSSGSELAFSAGLPFGMGLLLVGGVLGTIAWIGTLVKQGKQEQWGWLVCTLFFSGISTLIYLIVVPETPQYVEYTSTRTNGQFTPTGGQPFEYSSWKPGPPICTVCSGTKTRRCPNSLCHNGLVETNQTGNARWNPCSSCGGRGEVVCNSCPRS